jgi:rhodanese-related sulfurtransferase
MPFPLPLETLLGKPLMYLLFGIIGFAFGFVLEISGFGDSKKLAAQFYFKDLTVLKVMFTAIIVAMVLLFAAIGLGILDYNQVWVNPTYLWSGIVGGLIMGVGFIVGGFCPGTSLVSMATLKLDGLFFVLGGLTGIFLFGETVGLYENWWNGSDYGRLTIMDWLKLSPGAAVLIVVLMALFMFWGGEQLERIFGKKDLKGEPKLRIAGAGALALAAVGIILIGQPSTAEKWAKIEISKEAALAAREVQIHPGELLATMANDQLNLVMLDVRPEADYNLFHIHGALSLPAGGIKSRVNELLLEPAANTVYVVMSNDEGLATEAWRILTAESVPNVYILEGGINHWLKIFAAKEPNITPTPTPPANEKLAYIFPAALGDHYEAADPSAHEWKLEYTPKIKLQIQRDKSGGGCG